MTIPPILPGSLAYYTHFSYFAQHVRYTIRYTKSGNLKYFCGQCGSLSAN
jgi:hypothetical protein